MVREGWYKAVERGYIAWVAKRGKVSGVDLGESNL